MDNRQLIQEIKRLKEEKNAVILAHYYQQPEIYEIADFIGDSLELSKKAAGTEAPLIVFCGVRFMAETAKILSPEKTVLLPAMDAGCPMADMITADDVLELKKIYPEAAVVTYVNSSAETKAVCDYCCTSSNAVKLVREIPEKEIIFVPDKNLGAYIQDQVPEKKLYFWEGFCPVHHRVEEAEVDRKRAEYPGAEVVVHPECQPEVVAKADFAGSTTQIIKRAVASTSRQVIIGTEVGVVKKLSAEYPDKEFILLSDSLLCPNMKKTSLEDVLRVMEHNENVIEVPEDIRVNALSALERMMQYS